MSTIKQCKFLVWSGVAYHQCETFAVLTYEKSKNVHMPLCKEHANTILNIRISKLNDMKKEAFKLKSEIQQISEKLSGLE